MIILSEKLENASQVDATVTLTLDKRARSRLHVHLDDGREAGIFLKRGERLKAGDLLLSEHGLVVRVEPAPERVSSVLSQDTHRLARACYHLGNRHVALQIEPKRLRYLHDRVLDDMVRGLGLTVTVEDAPFEPEPGAYGGSAHVHEYDHHQH